MGLFGREALGLQVGPRDLKLVQVTLERSPKVTAFAVCAFEEVKEKEHPAGFDAGIAASLLNDVLKKNGTGTFKSRECYVSVPESAVFRKLIELPASLKEDELLSAISTDAASYLPSDPELMQIDYQVIPSSYLEKPDQAIQHLAVVAVEKAIIQEYVALCASSKLKLLAIDTQSASLARALISPRDTALRLLVSIESEVATVSLVQHGLVWATGQARVTEDASVTASGIIDEIEHITKFYTNRSGKTSVPKDVLLRADSFAAMKKALKQRGDYQAHEANLIVSNQIECKSSFAGAIGSGVYPLYNLL